MGTLSAAVISTAYKNIVFTAEKAADATHLYFTDGSGDDEEITAIDTNFTFNNTLATTGVFTANGTIMLGGTKTIGIASHTDLITLAADVVQIKAGDTLKADIITETTGTAGVTIEGVLLKDSDVVIPDGATIGCVGNDDIITLNNSANTAVFSGNIVHNVDDSTKGFEFNNGEYLTGPTSASNGITHNGYISSRGDFRVWKQSADTTAGQLILYKERALTTPVAANDYLGKISFEGRGSASATAPGATIECQVVESTPSASAMASNILFKTSPTGSTTPAEAMKIGQDKMVTLQDGLTFNSASKSIVFPDNSATAGYIKSSDSTNLMTIITSNGAEKIQFNKFVETSVGHLTTPQIITSDSDRTLTESQSGKTIVFNIVLTGGGSRVIKLPDAPTAGLNYRIMFGLAPSADVTIQSYDSNEKWIGGVIWQDGDNSSGGTHYLEFAVASHYGIRMETTIKAGSYIDVVFDGTSWFATGTVIGDNIPTVKL